MGNINENISLFTIVVHVDDAMTMSHSKLTNEGDYANKDDGIVFGSSFHQHYSQVKNE